MELETEEEHMILKAIALQFMKLEFERNNGIRKSRRATTATDILNEMKLKHPNIHKFSTIDICAEVINAFKALASPLEPLASAAAYREYHKDTASHIAEYIITQREKKKMSRLPPAKSGKEGGGRGI